MEKKLCSYETLYVVDASLTEEAVKAVVAKFTALATANATDLVVDEWGKRRFAYPIDYKNEGYYVLMSYKSEPSFPREIQRVLGITDGILRSMTTTKAEGAAPAKVEAPETVEATAPAVEETVATETEAPAAETAAE